MRRQESQSDQVAHDQKDNVRKQCATARKIHEPDINARIAR